MQFEKDPIGYLIHDFSHDKLTEDIIVRSDISEDDIIPANYFFRTFDEMPSIERKALELSKGRILDVGAAAGCHTKWLIEQGKEALALDHSKGAVEYLQSLNIPTVQADIFDFQPKEMFDTIIVLMNGLGIAGSLDNLTNFLVKLKSLLNEGSQILCDSTDISYMYEEDDGSFWVNLNQEYYGEVEFQMVYKEVESDWFPWLYVDPHTLARYCDEAGLSMEIIARDNDGNGYLARLTAY